MITGQGLRLDEVERVELHAYVLEGLLGAPHALHLDQRVRQGQPLGTGHPHEVALALTVLARGRVVALGTAKAVLGDIVGEYVIVLDAAAAPGVPAWLAARGRGEPASVLGAWHVPVSGEELAEFARAFPAVRYEVRGPTLDDLFLKLALSP